ncbi:hypothetical protein ACFQXA_32020 [Nocardiopsis composta]
MYLRIPQYFEPSGCSGRALSDTARRAGVSCSLNSSRLRPSGRATRTWTGSSGRPGRLGRGSRFFTRPTRFAGALNARKVVRGRKEPRCCLKVMGMVDRLLTRFIQAPARIWRGSSEASAAVTPEGR